MMLRTVCPAYLGCRESFYQTAPLIAAQGGFSGYYSYDIRSDTAQGVAETRQCFAEYGLEPAGFRLPVQIDAVPACFEEAFATLPRTVELASQSGYRSALTWIMPGSDEIPPPDHHAVLLGRLQRLGALLAEYEMTLCAELVAPYTLQQQYRYPIPATLDYLLELIGQTGMENIAAVLDVFHFYCAGHTETDYSLLRERSQIGTVHLSDGVAGRTPSEQLDQERRLPGETGVIRCDALFERLCELGYDGPVIPEPIDPALTGRPFSETLRHTAEALDRVWPRGCAD